MSIREAVIVDGVRTPVGRRNGALATWHPTDLLGHTLSTLVERTGVDANRIADVIAGCVLQYGEQAGNIARWASLAAGLPEGVPATTVDRQCGSGQQAVHFAAQAVRSGDYDFAIGCGVESMSRVDLGPLFNPRDGLGPWYGQRALARYENKISAQGPSAELVARKWGLTRGELDDYAAESHRRALVATHAGAFARQLVPLTTGSDLDGAQFTIDEGIRAEIDPAKLATLSPVFSADGLITAGNASQISDGAAAVLIADRHAAEAAGLQPRAAIRAMTVAADDPILQFTAILPAARVALERARLSIDDIDLVEVNEAFAPIPLIFSREFGVGPDRLNVHGGSIAIGHPLGSTGTRLLTDLVYALDQAQARYGLLVVCEGGGMANATVIERL